MSNPMCLLRIPAFKISKGFLLDVPIGPWRITVPPFDITVWSEYCLINVEPFLNVLFGWLDSEAKKELEAGEGGVA